MSDLPDGRYDVIVVDAETFDETTIRIELAMVDGDARGDVISIRGPRRASDPITLLGLPGVLVVENGVPSFRVERGA